MTNFPHNLPILRRQAGYTQEGLAEALGVSRQAVSKWESGATLPEAATLLTLADLLGCTLDQLMREALNGEEFPPPGAAEAAEEEARFALFVAYDKHMDRFARMIAGGVALCLLGLSAMMALFALFGHGGGLPVAPFLLCVAAAVFLFIFGGISHSDFQKAHPVLPDFYSPQAILEFRRIFRIGIACSVSAVVVDVALLVSVGSFFGSSGRNGAAGVAVFFLILAGAVGAMVLLGILHSKYDVVAYAHAAAEAQAAEDPNSPASRISGAIMSGATAIFLLAGFLFGAWHPAWVVFPISALLCGVVGNLKKS